MDGLRVLRDETAKSVMKMNAERRRGKTGPLDTAKSGARTTGGRRSIVGDRVRAEYSGQWLRTDTK